MPKKDEDGLARSPLTWEFLVARRANRTFFATLLASPTLGAVDAPELVRLVDVGFSVSGSVILRGVHMTIRSGDIVGVSGPNGAGKTTLLRLLATLLRPTSGTYSILGITTGCSPRELAVGRREIALIGHEPALWPELTLRENIDLVVRLRVDPPEHDVLQAVGLERAAGWKAGHASLGMQRRVEFARLLNQTPKLLLLDEPLAGLDRATRPLVDRIVGRVADRNGAAVLVSHDPDGATELVTRRVTVSAGTVSELP